MDFWIRMEYTLGRSAHTREHVAGRDAGAKPFECTHKTYVVGTVRKLNLVPSVFHFARLRKLVHSKRISS